MQTLKNINDVGIIHYIKNKIAKMFLLVGLNVSLVKKNELLWLKNMDIKTVIDIGANIGQSAKLFHNILPDSFIYSFEPLDDCFLQLNSKMKNVENFKSFKVALGDEKGLQKMYKNDFTPSSSLLKMDDLHKNLFPFTSHETIETIEIDTLDNIVTKLDMKTNILLKIDVQGYEDKVLIGSINTLKHIKVIIIEATFKELYNGQPRFSDIYDILYKNGFVFSGIFGDELNNPNDGTPLQADCIFINKHDSNL